MKKTLQLMGLFVFVSGMLQAQSIQNAAPSPLGKFSQMVGLTEISMEYSRPGVKGRKIFGTGEDYLLQYGELWRTGANAATRISFENDVKVNGKEVPAGTYAIYTKPGATEWTFILYNDLLVGGNYDNFKEEDVFTTFQVKPTSLPNKVESLTFGLNDITSSTANLHMSWENTRITLAIDTNTDAMIMAQIEDAVKNPMSGAISLYRSSANYYYNNDKDLTKALEWISKACELGNSLNDYETKANIQAKMGKYKDAIATVAQLHKMAESVTGNAKDFYNNTQKARVDAKVAEWKKK